MQARNEFRLSLKSQIRELEKRIKKAEQFKNNGEVVAMLRTMKAAAEKTLAKFNQQQEAA